MPNFIKIRQTGASWQYGEMYTSHTFYFSHRRFLGRKKQASSSA